MAFQSHIEEIKTLALFTENLIDYIFWVVFETLVNEVSKKMSPFSGNI